MSRIARQRRNRSRRPARRLLLIGLSVAVAAALAAVGTGIGIVVHYVDAAPPLSMLKPVLPGPNSQVFAADGTSLGYIQSDVLRSPVAWSEIPADLKNATVAIEDQRYWQHGGVDIKGIVRAAVADTFSHKTRQGASTIAMQLVRNLYLPPSQRTANTLKRKILEATEANRLAKRLSKQTILLRYLNSVPYGTVGGQNAIGVQAAARVFFNKTASQLTLAQCALLAGLPQAPSRYNPFLYPLEAVGRRNDVLQKMADQHYITQAQADAAKAEPLRTHHSRYYLQRRESTFFDYVTQRLIDTYGLDTVRQGGLRVYTTINLKMQNKARAAIATELNQPDDPAAAIVTEDPRTGYIEAMAQSGGSNNQYNLAAQAQRQPGSTMKAIDLADALAHGINPNSTYYQSHTLAAGWLPSNPTYEVKTFEGTSLNKSLNLVQATLASDNTIYAQLAADLGEQSVTQMAYRMGVSTHLDSYPAEALGGLTYGVTPLEMANVYSTLADGGYKNTQIAITRVVFADGHVDRHWGVPHRVKVLSDAITSEETSILEQNVQSGTAVRSAINCPTAAKTGTTSNLVDAWLDGYTPNYATIVWMGYAKQNTPMTSVHGEPQQGGYIPAQIWHDYMSQVVGSNCVSFPPPSDSIQYAPFNGQYQNGGSGPTTFGVPPSQGGGYTPGAPTTSGPAPSGGRGNRGSGGGAGGGAIGGGGGGATPGPGPTQHATPGGAGNANRGAGAPGAGHAGAGGGGAPGATPAPPGA
jgi:penicillin-binding protein 1A